jgi:hypothetical protein
MRNMTSLLLNWNQNEGVTLNSQKSRAESNMCVVDLSHLVNSENLNNYSNITNRKGNNLLKLIILAIKTTNALPLIVVQPCT